MEHTEDGVTVTVYRGYKIFSVFKVGQPAADIWFGSDFIQSNQGSHPMQEAMKQIDDWVDNAR